MEDIGTRISYAGLIIMLMALALMMLALLEKYLSERKQKRSPYKLIAEGKYDHVEYVNCVTIVYFEDGSHHVLNDGLGHGIHYFKGTKIRILKGDQYYKIEKVE